MRLPTPMPSTPRSAVRKSTTNAAGPPSKGLSQAGCCAQVCTPFGCHCVLDLPVCP